MICKVIETIDSNNLLDGVSTVCVGVSGGADSMCLLHILSRLKEKYGIILKVAHINHNLRGAEALRDEEVVRKYCSDNNIEFTLFSEDISALSAKMGIGEEECGRIVRYRCFDKMKCDAVAVAHSLSDCAETFIYNLLRGAGTKGLTSIPVKRDNIIRPLLDCSREEIICYCNKNNIEYVTDSSNLTDDYTRNYIRHNIIPAFEKVNRGYLGNISNTVRILKENDDYIEKTALTLIGLSEVSKGKYNISVINENDKAIIKRVCYILLSNNMNKSPEYKHIDMLSKIIEKGEGKIEIAKNYYAHINKGVLVFSAKPENTAIEWESVCDGDTFYSPYASYSLISSVGEKYNTFDRDKISGDLLLTSRKSGDEFFFVKRCIKKSLKKLFNEMKIPADDRNKKAVLRSGSEIIWVEDVGVNGYFLPDENTVNFLTINKDVYL